MVFSSLQDDRISPSISQLFTDQIKQSGEKLLHKQLLFMVHTSSSVFSGHVLQDCEHHIPVFDRKEFTNSTCTCSAPFPCSHLWALVLSSTHLGDEEKYAPYHSFMLHEAARQEKRTANIFQGFQAQAHNGEKNKDLAADWRFIYNGQSEPSKKIISCLTFIESIFSLFHSFPDNGRDTQDKHLKELLSSFFLECEILFFQTEDEPDEFHEWLTNYLFDQYALSFPFSYTPYQALLLLWAVSRQQQTQLHKIQERTAAISKEFPFDLSPALAASAMAMHKGEKEKSLKYLVPWKGRLEPDVVLFHLQSMYASSDWSFLEAFLHKLFTDQAIYRKTQLLFYKRELFLQKYNLPPEELDLWDKWVARPGVLKFNKQQKNSALSKERILEYILPRLEASLQEVETKKLYVRLISQEKLYSRGLRHLLSLQKSPGNMTDEERQLLAAAEQDFPEQTLALYHQYFLQCIKKKNITAYQEAIVLLKKMKRIYISLERPEAFQIFLKQIKQRYSTYQALIRELKAIEPAK
ncbi:hypothetical protein ACFPU1_07100 [Thalassorhabdus alkalitolerans]|uniref:SWIM-type domain-containing protein n=1 Tax=Thalassorhabdus alkalitolerans TaxID=2282697 RepID=A0ABW0YMN6_9BACI